MYNFRVIPANEEIFIKTRNKYKTILDEFNSYAQMLTVEAGNAKTKSGKASSYTRYLIRLIIFYSESNDDEIIDLSSFETLKKIEKIKHADEFQTFNQASNRFYSATISCYLAYVTYKNSNNEEVMDNYFNHSLNTIENNPEDKESINLINTPKMRHHKRRVSKVYSYPRNSLEALEAKKRSNWTCEFDKEHRTFINIKNRNPHVEAHHLIPMAAQDYYENTIDFADNIVCLCPTCHSRIHYAIQSEKKEMIVELFNKRKNHYLRHGINIDEKLLFNFYGII
ncbi:HNH endonuclease [Listeria booriae]|uniref:HNH endonuclease n=1 Tax=Listeria booriae TaxID=1552123 RepID=UPI001624D9ED|nr:HNH endonuclease signature motif containing protein [Listeria booriae]MBC1291490.1 HNH endonuclease [Listeria booriae]MBC2304851.1 HNH endonuclease [Listeria booriae]MBC6136355.1 HNH endonuclease [Listeria booriae]